MNLFTRFNKWRARIRTRWSQSWQQFLNLLYQNFGISPKFEKDLNALLKPREEVQSLYIMMISGKPSEAQQAFSVLTAHATNPRHTAFTWANKALSYIYKSGVKGESFECLPDTEKAQHYAEIAAPGLKHFEIKVIRLTKKIASSWFNFTNKLPFLKKLADTSIHFAQHEYAQKISATSKEEASSYFIAAAEGNSETLLTFESQGYLPAKEYLVKARDFQSLELTTQRCSHYRFQIALEGSNPQARVIKYDALQGDVTAGLQLILLYLEKQTVQGIKTAEQHFQKVLQQIATKTSSEYDSQLLERICLILSDYYETLFLNSNASKTFSVDASVRNYIEKIIFYLRALPTTSKFFQLGLYRIEHYQKYFLEDKQSAFDTFIKYVEQNPEDTSLNSVFMAIKDYWSLRKKAFTPKEQAVIAAYEARNRSYFDDLRVVKNLCPMQQVENDCKKNFQALLIQMQEIAKRISAENNIYTKQYEEFCSFTAVVDEQLVKKKELPISSMGPRLRGDDMVCGNDTSVAKVLNSFDKKMNNELDRLTQFYFKDSKPVPNEKTCVRETTVLNAAWVMLLNLVPDRTHLEATKNDEITKRYMNLVERTYFEFVVKFARSLFYDDRKLFEIDEDLKNNIQPRRGKVYAN